MMIFSQSPGAVTAALSSSLNVICMCVQEVMESLLDKVIITFLLLP